MEPVLNEQTAASFWLEVRGRDRGGGAHPSEAASHPGLSARACLEVGGDVCLLQPSGSGGAGSTGKGTLPTRLSGNEGESLRQMGTNEEEETYSEGARGLARGRQWNKAL